MAEIVETFQGSKELEMKTPSMSVVPIGPSVPTNI